LQWPTSLRGQPLDIEVCLRERFLYDSVLFRLPAKSIQTINIFKHLAHPIGLVQVIVIKPAAFSGEEAAMAGSSWIKFLLEAR